ncbi:MAG TPA: S8 family serine peptidase, partial [Gaiellaceae bacterium]|nr:S8 family serine peptidase [Gaiellaceae bacterium]
GFDDASTGSLPLIVEYEGGSRPAVPAVQPERTLESINSVGARESKARAAELGRALAKARHGKAGNLARAGGSASSAPSSTGIGPLAGVKKIWLDGTVRVALDASVPQIGAPKAWQSGFDGTGITVAVLDTGIDADHPDLAGKVLDARNFTDSDTVTDRHGHGTHLASTIVGTGAASGGSRKGVAPGATLINGKVLGDYGSGATSGIIDGMEWATGEKGARIVNMSLGGRPTDGTDPLSEAVNTLSDRYHALFVIAAGNRGPRTKSVSSPGAATAALTVGAVDKSDVLARFSSRGPRVGDLAIKPEITAPGVAIVAARASGTEMGSAVDAWYTSASGTSMATPHVAGAAALMLQAHPGWNGEQLKGALVSTATRNSTNTVFEQGNGRVDLARGITSKAFALPGVLNLGFFAFPHTGRPAITRTVTYMNVSSDQLTLDLSLDAHDQNGTGGPAPSGTLALSSGTLTLPANGSASVDVILDTSKGSLDEIYAGALTATQRGGDTVLRTPLTFYLEPEKYDLTVSAIARDGRATDARSGVIVMNVDDSTRYAAGRSFVFGDPVTFRVPIGTYSVFGSIYTEDGPRYTTVETVLVGKPELEVRRDMTLVLDARESSELVIETPDHETKQRWNESFDSWAIYRKPLEGPSLSFTVIGDPGNVFAQATEPVTKGEFEVYTRWHLEAPDLKARVSSPIALELHPVNPFPGNTDNPRLEGRHVLPVVYANEGSIEDFAGLDVRGKAVLMRKPNLDCPETGCINQPNNAAAAGAAVAFVYNEYELGKSLYFGYGQMDIPTLQLPGSEGQQLRELIARGPVKLELE